MLKTEPATTRVLKAANRDGFTPLALACVNGQASMIEALLKAGADANERLLNGETALMMASRTGNVEAVKLLLAKGAGANAVSKTEGLPKIQTGTVEFGGWTPLLMSAAFGPPEAVDVLLKAGVLERGEDGRVVFPYEAIHVDFLMRAA